MTKPPKVHRTPPGSVYTTQMHGESVRFCVTAPKDVIQQYHVLGRFYEQEELSQIRRFLPIGGVYVDIGTNIGNHALYVAKFLRPSKIIAFEPNPPAIELLQANIALNDVWDVFDLTHLGKGIGTPKKGVGFDTPARNLGATKLVEGTGDIEVVSGDSVLHDKQVHMIKIDVEGMEMEVLSSLSATIARTRPAILIEVDTANRGAFQEWINENRYGVAMRFRRYAPNQNFIITPKPVDPAPAAKG